MPTPSEMELIRALAGFRYALRGFLSASEAVSRAAGITPQQYQAMLAICAWPGPMAIKDLADQMLMNHSSAVQLFDRLAAAGLAQREPSPTDRRVVLVKLTPRGREVLSSLAADHLREMQRRERDLSLSLRRLAAIQRP